MKHSVLCLLLSAATAAHSQLGSSERQALSHHDKTLLARDIIPNLQRRGNKKNKKRGSSKPGGDEQRSSSGQTSSSQALGSPQSVTSRRAPSSAQSSPSGQLSLGGSQTQQPITTPSNRLTHAPPLIPPFTSPSSSGRRVDLPFAAPPIPPFTSPTQSQSRSSSGRQRGLATNQSVDEVQSRLMNLRVKQDSGASPSSSGQSNTPPGIPPVLHTYGSPRASSRASSPQGAQQAADPQHETQHRQSSSGQRSLRSVTSTPEPARPGASRSRSPIQVLSIPGPSIPGPSRSDLSRSESPTHPYQQLHMPPDAGISSSQEQYVGHDPLMGISIEWLARQKKRTQTYTNLGNQPTDGIPNLNIKQHQANHAVNEAKARGLLAQGARHKARADAKDAAEVLARNRPLSPTTEKAVDKGLESTFKAKEAMYTHHEAQNRAAAALEKTRQFGDAGVHSAKSSRAFARHDLYSTYGRAMSYKWSDQIHNHPSVAGVGKKVGPYAADKFYHGMYKLTAKDYHRTYSGHQIVRGVFDGSSSDESEKDTFEDVVPWRRPT